MKVMLRCCFPSCLLLFVTILLGFILSNSATHATIYYDYGSETIDNVSIGVPVSCNLTGTNTDHTATINNGTYQSDIGTTTLNVSCNDGEGFAIYAIGYTDETEGKNVLTSPVVGSTYDIVTGTATSGNTSNWAVKLATNSNATYPVTIENNFNNYHNVPNEYTMVAKRLSGTDIGASATGSTLTTTYQAYVAATQPSGSYQGKVKYILIHPNYVNSNAFENAATVIFDGNGLTFPDGSTTNTVRYAEVCKPGDTVYVGNDYEEAMSSNISIGGAQNNNSPYTGSEHILQNIPLNGADAVKIVLDYGITGDTMGIEFVGADWDGDWDNFDDNWYDNGNIHELYDDENVSGTETFTLNLEDNTLTIYAESWNTPESGYDYGFYARIYPIYYSEQPNTTAEQLSSTDCSIMPISGGYVETTTWNGKWTEAIDGSGYEFAKMFYYDEMDNRVESNNAERSVVQYISQNYDLLEGTTLTLYAYNPVSFDMVYAAANKTKVNGYYKIQDLSTSMCANVTLRETTTVIDIRDNNTYSIGKLKDGNCWLRNDLILDPTDPTTAANMSASNTNASSDAIYNFLNGGNHNNNEGWSSVAIQNLDNWSSFNQYTSPLMSIYSGREPNSGFYNYCAASVGTYCYNINPGVWSTGNIDIDNDLCPAGWKMPTMSEYYELSSYPSDSAYYNNNPQFVADFNPTPDRSFNVTSSNGYAHFWTVEASRANHYSSLAGTYEYQGGGYTKSFNPAGDNYSYRTRGHYVRCLINTSN